ncbi:MAG: molybdopterin-dependent oxidoreductase [Lachnospiraceae bacterium]|nr:molybdopterin-dependent oxidoreductase [Lachnospiraceae bacterium]
MKKEHEITRRTFLKGSAAAGLLAGIGGATLSDFSKATARAEGETQEFFNACPRNCYDTCSIITTVQDGVIKHVRGNPNSTYTNGRLCVKGYNYPRRVYSPDRIKYPMRQSAKGSGQWEQITWDEAFTIIAEKILEIKNKYGNTLPICLNKYSGNFNVLTYGIEGMMSSIGHTTRCQGTPCWPAGIDSQNFDMGAILNADPESMLKSKMIIVWGANPAWCSVHSMHIIQKAKENGAKVVFIDPIMTASASKADQFIEIKSSTDGALALGMCRYILDHKLQDDAWMEENSIGHEEFVDYVKKNITVEWASEKTGVPVQVIENLAYEYATMEPASIWIGYGMQRHTNGGANVRCIDALAALCGNVGKMGAGANYAQLDSWLFNYAAMTGNGANTDNVEADRNININNFGADLLSLTDPPVEMLWVACRNPMGQDPETGVVRKAYESCDLVVTVDQFFNESCNMSDIVLPCCTIFETWGLHASYWHYWYHGNQPAIAQMYESKTDVEIAMGLSEKLNSLQAGSCTYPTDRTMEEWCAMEMTDGAKELFGFKDWKEIFEKGTAKVTGYEAAWSDGQFRTPSGKYEFYSEQAAAMGNHLLPVYREADETKTDEYNVRLITPHWKYGLHSQFQNLDWMQDIHNEPFVEIHPQMAKDRGIEDGDAVRVENEIGYLVVKAKLTQNVPRDEAVIYEAWYKDNPFNVNYVVKAIPADMGVFATGQPGVSFHDSFVSIKKA